MKGNKVCKAMEELAIVVLTVNETCLTENTCHHLGSKWSWSSIINLCIPIKQSAVALPQSKQTNSNVLARVLLVLVIWMFMIPGDKLIVMIVKFTSL